MVARSRSRSAMHRAMSHGLHVVRAGRGPTVVLVHGSATDHATWTIQIASSLTEHVRLVAYDRRGTGRGRQEGEREGAQGEFERSHVSALK